MDERLSAWVNKQTGEIFIFHQASPVEGYSEATHDLLHPAPPELFDGRHDWDPVTRSVVLGNVPEPVPQAVTSLQLRLALIELGHDTKFDTYFARQQTPKAAKASWQFAQRICRDASYLTDAAQSAGVTQAQLDEVFRLATTKDE